MTPTLDHDMTHNGNPGPNHDATKYSYASILTNPSCREAQPPVYDALWGAASHSSHYLKPYPGGRNGPSLCRQDERQYNQRSQQHARYEREHRLQWVRLEMAASLCSPVHRGPHGSLLLADPIIYPKKHRNSCHLARAVGAMYDLLLGQGALPCPSRNSRNFSTGTTLSRSLFPTRSRIRLRESRRSLTYRAKSWPKL
jgi:hypothetical protein